MTWTKTRILGFGLALALIASACGSSAEVSAPGQAASVLDGEFAALDGRPVDLAALQGQDLVLWFWAPW